MIHSEQINELLTALSKAQGEIAPALKDSINPHFKSRYADLSSIWSACRTQLSKYGLAVIQTTAEINGKIILITTLGHSSGQWMRSELPVIVTKNDAQGLGSALTYMRRYSLAAMVGVAPDDDDDGNAASASPLKKMPSKEQVNELNELLAMVPEYKDSVLKSLKQPPFNGISIENLTIEVYDRIKKGALKRIEELQNEDLQEAS